MLEIRAMQAEDLEAVVRTESQIFSRPWSRKGFEDALRQKETIYLVAYEKDILAGGRRGSDSSYDYGEECHCPSDD